MSASVEERMQRLQTKTNLITQKLRDIWNRALNTPVDVEAKWLHEDLHPRNILVDNGAIAGIIDWGDITSGDIATDLAILKKLNWLCKFSQSQTSKKLTGLFTAVTVLHNLATCCVIFRKNY